MSNINTADCSTNQLGTGLPSCIADVNYPVGVILTPKSWSEARETTIDKSYIQQKIQEKVFIPIINATSFEQTTPDPTTQEFPNGVVLVVRNGKPQFTFTYVASILFQKVLASYNSYQQYNVIMVFDNDVLFLADDGTNLKGFSATHVNTNTYMFNTGSEVGQAKLQIQLLDNKQFNEGSILDPNFDVTNDINGIIDATITGTAVAGGDITVSVTAMLNEASSVEGLTDNEFRILLNGVAEVPTTVSYDATNETYVLTPTSTTTASDEVVVQLSDNLDSKVVAQVGDLFYQGSSNVITVA